MNLPAKLIASALALAALPAAQAVEFEDTARVTRVQPRMEQISRPREECRTEYVQVPVQPQRSPAGSIIGGIAGAVLGNQVGDGSGRVAATAAGAIAGTVIGDRVSNQNAPRGGVQEQAVRQCRMVDAYETRTVGYDVTYDYRGQSYTSTMSYDPGQRLRVRVSVEPVDR
ncbi:glycine zipper 2TM domain-containing protein [Pseudoduganella sp. GCM10020061]|jgi:uncharacterized protein YcfJ|uniref:glycine zipper 2TM domain-containing protein n=1 Tax=Pseudoduganella sp. GCM10020061 TaxID=3317345 RepID=UPI00362885AF